MSHPDIIPSVPDGPGVSAARTRLDCAVLGYNRHAIVVERDRVAIRRIRTVLPTVETEAAEREALKGERALAAVHRATIRGAVGEFVRLMRDAGLPPQTALIAVKCRLAFTVTKATPGAPLCDAELLAVDLSTWAINAYYDAA